MKNSLMYLLYACAIIGACVGLDCYSCVGSEGSPCADPFDGASAGTESCVNGSVCQVLGVLDRGQYIRGCNPRDTCSPGCVKNAGAAGEKGVCSYCCEDDLCNNRSIADGVADILHCYICRYDSSMPGSSECLDPKNESVTELPCDGVCGCIHSRFVESIISTASATPPPTARAPASRAATPRASAPPAAPRTSATGERDRSLRQLHPADLLGKPPP